MKTKIVVTFRWEYYQSNVMAATVTADPPLQLPSRPSSSSSVCARPLSTHFLAKTNWKNVRTPGVSLLDRLVRDGVAKEIMVDIKGRTILKPKFECHQV